MPDPTGRWVDRIQWQCPKCGWFNDATAERCQKCDASVRPSRDEPVRPPDPLDLVSHPDAREDDAGTVGAATDAIQTLSRVTRERAMALFGVSLRTGLRSRGDQGAQAWQAIAEMPESDQRAALGSLVDDLEQEGFALYAIRDDEPG